MHLTLFFFCTTAVFSSIFARNGSPGNCCLKRSSNTVNLTSIVSYWRQDKGLCPITAIVFTLQTGKDLCSDPASPWTKRAMQKVDEEAKQKPNHRFGLAPDSPPEGTEGLLTATMFPLTSRWPQVPASVAMSMGKQRADSKPRRGTMRRVKIIKKKRKGKSKGGKVKRKNKKQPASNHTSTFTTTSSN